jgi:type IV secretion system protein VirB4
MSVMADQGSLVGRWMRREREPDDHLPYAWHVDDQAIALDGGGLMVCFALDGASFETADLDELNDRHARLNGVWRNLADERLALWHHLVRREQDEWPQGAFRSDFARRLDDAYRAAMAKRRLFANELYLTLVLRRRHDAGAWITRLKARESTWTLSQDLLILKDASRDLVQHLGRFNPRPLGLYEDRGVCFSEPLEMLRLVMTGKPSRAPLVRGHLGRSIYRDRLIFGRETIEIREAGETRFAAMLGVKEYPATTRPGLWDDLLSARLPLTISQSFTFISKTAARSILERKQNQMISAHDRAASQIRGLGEALDDLTSNRFVMGDHQASVLVHASTPSGLADAASKVRAVLADSGLVAVREDLGLEGAFWAQFPGGFRRRTRPAAITSRNFAGLAPFHTFPAGRRDGNHWGGAVALLRTAAGSPFYFNFHVGDLGHTFICGPSGSGKTVIQNFLMAELEKFGARQLFIDKDRGAEIFVRACGGTYLSLRNGQPTGFAPFKALTPTPGNQAFLSALVRQLVCPPGERLGVQAERAIDDGVAALARLPTQHRSLSALRALLGQQDAGGIGARLERWSSEGALGWVLDNDADTLALDVRFAGFDMTEILDNAEVRTPAMMYLFHRITDIVDGARLVLDIDEFWKALGDEAFRSLAEDGLKTWRKQNAFMVFGTQSPADVLRSPIAHTIVEMCATKIFLPNPHGVARDYIEGFGLTAREFRLVREELSPEQRRFLVKQGHDSVVVELDLAGLDAELAILSGRAETVELLDRLRATHGDAPAAWLSAFHEQRRSLR